MCIHKSGNRKREFDQATFSLKVGTSLLKAMPPNHRLKRDAMKIKLFQADKQINIPKTSYSKKSTYREEFLNKIFVADGNYNSSPGGDKF